jgi:DNA ligase-1
MQSDDTEELSAFLAASVQEGCEGLMVKTLEENAKYLPSRRSLNWLKLKKVGG